MTSSQTFELDRLLDRLEEDLSSGEHTARYDPSGDILTLVFARPEAPVTSHDRTDGVYLDFDPEPADPRLATP